jgi:WD repeat-containing protein 68
MKGKYDFSHVNCRVLTLTLTLKNALSRSVNAQSWAPHSSCHICTGGEDHRALIWDLGNAKAWGDEETPDPILAYDAEGRTLSI